MIRLSLPTTLVAYLPGDEGSDRGSRTALSLAASTWPEAVSEIRERFPLLAGRVLEAAGETTAERIARIAREQEARRRESEGARRNGAARLPRPGG